MKKAYYNPNPLLYTKAPSGAPDKFVTTIGTSFSWVMPRKWRKRIPTGVWSVSSIYGPVPFRLTRSTGTDDREYLRLYVPSPFYFAVSVAPSFRRSLPGACLHDCIYLIARPLAEKMGLSVREVLAFGDDWFGEQLESSGFLLDDTYHFFVRRFGYLFNTLTHWFRRKEVP